MCDVCIQQDLPFKATSLSISRDLSCLAVTGGKDVYLVDATSFDVLHTIQTPRENSCAEFNAEKKRLLTGCEAEMWCRGFDLSKVSTAGESVDAKDVEVFVNKGHHGQVFTVAFAPNGANFSTGSEDGTIRIHDWNDCVASAGKF